MVKLAWLYCQGEGDFMGEILPKDYTKAREWFQKAIDMGNMEAMWGMGCLYEDGHGVPFNKQKAIDYWIKGAEAGNTSSWLALGSYY